MGKVDYDQKTGAFEITYGGRESPFMGIDSSAPDPYIGPNQLTQNSINALVNNGTLIATFFQQLSFIALGRIIIGFGDLIGQVFSVSVDGGGNVYIDGYPAWPSTVGFYNIATIPTSTIYGTALNIATPPNTLTYKNINGVCYFSWPGCPLIFQHNNLAGNILTTTLGCSFLSELNGRLIAANVWQINAVESNYISPVFGAPITTQVTVNSGTANITSAGYGSFPSTAIIAGQIVNLTVNISGGFSAYPTDGTGCSGIATFQYSIDSGVTWITFYTWNATAVNFTLSAQNITIPNLGSVANIDTIQVRVIVTATGAAGYTASIATLISDASVIVVTADSLNINNYPFEYAWSAATGQYSQFNPLSTDSNGNLISTGAGYNNLPDVEDSITGLFNTGPTQFILRGQGITEVTALSNGLNPFEFDHLWASHKGIGTVFPQTVGQYGSMGGFFSDTGIFTFGYDGINEIGGKATSAIYNDLIGTCAANLLAGGFGPIYINGEVYLAYVLAAVDVSTNVIYVWMWNSKTKEWYRFQQQLPQACAGLQVIAVNIGTIPQTLSNSLYINALVAGGESSFTIALPITGATATAIVGGMPIIASNFIFSAEEIKFDRDVTINGIAVYYNCQQNVGELIGACSINGLQFESLAVINPNVIFDGTWRNVLLSAINNTGASTGKNPQLTIAATITGTTAPTTAKFQISKIVLIGSVDITQEIGNE